MSSLSWHRPLWAARLGALWLGLALAATQALALDRPVTGPAELASALRDAAPGETLILAPGDYGDLRIQDLAGAPGRPITLRSADPANRASFDTMTISKSAHLVLDGVLLDYTYSPGDTWKHQPFNILGSTDIALRNSVLDGDRPFDLGPDAVDFGTGFGLAVRDSRNIEIRGNEVRDFFRGLIFRFVETLVIAENDIHTMRMDGMTLAQVTDTVIEHNHIRDFNRSVNSGDHADMIQFWTASTNKPTRNVTIRNNILNSGTGAFTQSIFMRNELVDRGKAGDEMLYRNIRIENNVIINAHLHGITVGEGDGIFILNNTLIRNRASVGTRHKKAFYDPQIRVAKKSRNVEVRGNVGPRFPKPQREGNWRIEGNFEIQDSRRGASNHYDALFANAIEGDPRDLRSFLYRPDSPIDGKSLGSSQLVPDSGN